MSIDPQAINVLTADGAIVSDGIKKTLNNRDLKVFAVEHWRSEGQTFTWNVHVIKKGTYRVAVLAEVKGLSPGVPVTLQLSGRNTKSNVKQTNTAWNKIYFPESLMLDSGNQKLQLELLGIPENDQPEINLYSIELATGTALQQAHDAAESLRSKPMWLTTAKYGLFFHWNSRSKPRTGQPATYVDAVRNFDVKKFAAMVRQTGAEFIVLTTSWGGFTFPAPLISAENIVPGSTTPRDLIADLSNALAEWKIKLLVYCNFRLDRFGLQKNETITSEKLDSGFNKMISIYSEIAGRYKNKIAGFWIDDGMALYPYNAPFERLTRVMKRADKNVVVCYNSWIYPRFTDFQDFFGGEFGINLKAAGVNNENLPVGGNGYFISGGQEGLKATFCGQLEKGDWTHTEVNTEISPPILQADELINIIREGMRRKNVAIMNVSVYQDGSVSAQTFDLLKQLNRAVHQ